MTNLLYILFNNNINYLLCFFLIADYLLSVIANRVLLFLFSGTPELFQTHFAHYVAKRFSNFMDSKRVSELNGDKKRNMEFLGGKKRNMEFLGGKKRNMEFLGGKKRNMEFLGGKKRFSEFIGGKKRFSEFIGGKKRFSEFIGGK